MERLRRIGARQRRVAVVLLLLAGLLVIAGGAWSNGAQQRRCDRLATARLERAGTVTGSGERILVIGDSWSAGRGLADPAASWPSQLDGRVHVDGFSGSGFSRGASPCPGRAYADRIDQALYRVSARPDLVVLQGGLNETDRTAESIREGVRRALGRLVARGVSARDVVVLGPVAAPARASRVPRVDAVLAEETRRLGVRYLSVTDLDLAYLHDDLHLTPGGHEEFGEAVAALL